MINEPHTHQNADPRAIAVELQTILAPILPDQRAISIDVIEFINRDSDNLTNVNITFNFAQASESGFLRSRLLGTLTDAIGVRGKVSVVDGQANGTWVISLDCDVETLQEKLPALKALVDKQKKDPAVTGSGLTEEERTLNYHPDIGKRASSASMEKVFAGKLNKYLPEGTRLIGRPVGGVDLDPPGFYIELQTAEGEPLGQPALATVTHSFKDWLGDKYQSRMHLDIENPAIFRFDMSPSLVTEHLSLRMNAPLEKNFSVLAKQLLDPLFSTGLGHGNVKNVGFAGRRADTIELDVLGADAAKQLIVESFERWFSYKAETLNREVVTDADRPSYLKIPISMGELLSSQKTLEQAVRTTRRKMGLSQPEGASL